MRLQDITSSDLSWSNGGIDMKGAFVLAVEVIKYSISTIKATEKGKDEKSKRLTPTDINKEYYRRHLFLSQGKLLHHVADAMERDYAKLRRALLDELEKRKEDALRRYYSHSFHH